jgi:restriction system protein
VHKPYLGYEARVTSFSGDDGIDVILDGPANELIGVQVKRYADRIGVDQIRELTGALFIGGYTRGIFVTTSSFQSGGERTADMSTRRGIPVELMDAERFYGALQIAQINAYTDEGVQRPWASLATRAISR